MLDILYRKINWYYSSGWYNHSVGQVEHQEGYQVHSYNTASTHVG